MQEVDPKVSTASRFLTSTFFSDRVLAVMASEMVMHPKRPSGTLATRIPIPKIIQDRIPYPINNQASKKNEAPRPNAIMVIIITNLNTKIIDVSFICQSLIGRGR
jgi:hypothetical protein